MAVIIDEKYNILVIQTDSYAGNFESDMADYIVGNGHNIEYKNSDGENMFDSLDEYLESVTDDHGDWVFSSMLESKNHTYNNVGIFFVPDTDISKFPYLKTFKDRANKYAKKNKIKILGFNIVEVYPTLLVSNSSGKNTKVKLDNKRVRDMIVAR